MTTQNRLTPQEEFNRLPAYVRDRLIAWQKHRHIDAAASEIGCHRDTMSRTLREHGSILYRLVTATDERTA